MCSKRKALNFGFSFIELVVFIGIFGVLISLIIVAVNPVTQLKKTRDTQRASDLKAIQVGLEAYRIANNSYPLSTQDFKITGTNWGGKWDTYMQLPADPSPEYSYAYVSQLGDSYQIYARFESTPPRELACTPNCGPNGLYNAGLASSNSSLAAIMFVPTPTPTATPTPTDLPQGKVSYFGTSATYPKIIQVDFDPLDVPLNQTQLLTAKVWSENPIETVTVYVQLDNMITETYQLAQTSTVISNGIYRDVWSISIPHTDSHNTTYTVFLTATDTQGNTISPEIIIR